MAYMFLVGRGYHGGFKSSEAMTLLLESTTLTVLLTNRGAKMPGFSTIHELVNAVSNETRERIYEAQLRTVLHEKWDDFSKLLVDSTDVEANTEWPKDSHLMVRLLSRLLHRSGKLEEVGLTVIDEPRAKSLLKKLARLDRWINMSAHKPGAARQRKKSYAKMLLMANKALALFEPHVQRVEKELGALNVRPSRHHLAQRLVGWLRADMKSLLQVIECCQARVMLGEKVPVEQKVLSISDDDAGFIVKGGREPTVGYKPQLGRSGAGFIVGLIVPQGNAADSGQLVPMFNQVVDRTRVTPTEVSVDDGYSSREGREAIKKRGTKIVSISGAKGKRLTPSEDWEDPDYVAARAGRSAIESLMFTLKHGFDFGRVARRGQENVRAEMLEKVLAYNFCRMASRRQQVHRSDQIAA
ncbi:MAG: transposase [Deltaproteobacteria bacterium]|nr:transposase [Deltaproteobacteria bacterium]